MTVVETPGEAYVEKQRHDSLSEAHAGKNCTFNTIKIRFF